MITLVLIDRDGKADEEEDGEEGEGEGMVEGLLPDGILTYR